MAGFIVQDSTGAVKQVSAVSLVNLVTGVTSILPIANGGTNAATASAARTSLGLVIGTDIEAHDADLTALAGVSSNGMLARTGAGTASARTITAGTGIAVTNGDGVSGNPTVTLTPTEFTTTTTGNIDDLNFSNADIIRMNNATVSTIRGLVAGTAGQVVTIVSIGAGEVDFAHQNTNSAVANRLINYVTSGVTPLAAGVGTAIYQYDGTTARWRLVAHQQGAAIAVPYSAGDYTASASMTWTVEAGDVATNAFFLNGRQLTVIYFISTTTVGGVLDSQLRIAIPNGYTIATSQLTPSQSIDNGTALTGLLSANTAVSTTKILVFRDFAGANWVAATNATHVRGSLTFPTS